MHRVTQHQIATSIGCSQITVSRALRNDLRVAESLRRRVGDAAARLGYRPDPLLSALVACRRHRSARSLRASLAFVYAGNEPSERVLFSNFEYFQGVRQKAEQLGFNLEPLRLDPAQREIRRLGQILRHRGVQGCIFALASGHLLFDSPLIELEGFGAVSLGYSFARQPVDCIMPDHQQCMSLAIEKALAKGYRRIGCVVSAVHNQRIGHAYTDVYRRKLEDLRLYEPALLHLRHLPGDAGDKGDHAVRLAGYLDAMRPDIVIGCVGSRVSLDEILSERGLQLGRDLAYIGLDLRRRKFPDDSGFLGNRSVLGEMAVETVYEQIVSNQTGVPRFCRRTLVQSEWREGTTY